MRIDDSLQEADLSVKYAEHAQKTYDKVAAAYDDLWSKNVAEPNAKLTKQLALKKGDRLVDLACGTGVFTLDMARHVVPGETVGVDYSAGMLDAAKELAAQAGLARNCSWIHAKAEDFITTAPAASVDVLSFRFALAYIDWKNVLPQIGPMMRKGGRVGILTSLAGSIPQAWDLYRKFTEGFGEAEFPSPVPNTTAELNEALEKGGLRVEDSWEFDIRLWFDTGMQAATWMRESGYATHPSLGTVSPDAMEGLMQLFAAGMEGFREEKGVPLDLLVAGSIAVRR